MAKLSSHAIFQVIVIPQQANVTCMASVGANRALNLVLDMTSCGRYEFERWEMVTERGRDNDSSIAIISDQIISLQECSFYYFHPAVKARKVRG
jgi:hypothetical protein